VARRRPGRDVRRAVLPTAGAALALALAGCITPAVTDDQYNAKAVAAVEAASSEVATVHLVVSQRAERKVTSPYADEVVTASETALDAIEGAFGAVQPPSPLADATYDEVSEVLGSARDAVTHTRFAVRRDDGAAYADLLEELGSAGDDLSALEARLKK
jgi:hypothetical protein